MDDKRTLGPTNRTLYWGDFHKHITGPVADVEDLDAVIEYASYHLDVLPVLAYPFKWYRKGREAGVREESTGQDPDYEAEWEAVQRIASDWLDPGRFVTFPSYEWHGNRTRWGDHNVFYREEGNPIDDAWELPDLYENLRDRDALALPHHTGYQVGDRGKDWSEYDPELSPVMEVYSSHGSSEGVATPVAMAQNDDMGPRTTGGTLQDALDRGHRVGVIASNDAPGLPGSWSNGVAGVWATELTRDGVWEALQNRRTFGSTGDRISLWWELDGHPMGSTIHAGEASQASVSVDCPQPLDRVELVHNGSVVDTYTHQDAVRGGTSSTYRMLVEFGWGPNPEYGDFDSVRLDWDGDVSVDGADVSAVYPRFTRLGQRYQVTEDGGVSIDLTTYRGEEESVLPEEPFGPHQQGLVLEFDATDVTDVVVDLGGLEDVVVPFEHVRDSAHLHAFMDEVRERFRDEFELDADHVENPDALYHNARKLKIHPAHSLDACVASVTFDDVPTTAGQDYYYVRVAQVDGQYAWSSPIWVE